ncbi:MAG: response regulator transcription factor [Burkholderiales bacterium]|nr:response regulator transcription factor [Burkholderiales bacterium]
MTKPVALIAEDEPNLALALKDALARVWPELKIADVVGNGPAALHAVDAHSPEVLFLDIRMPGLTGLQVAERLANSAAGDGPLVVFVTAYNEYAVQAFEREAVDYLVKPVDDERLAETVARVKKRLAAREGAAGTVAAPEIAPGELARALALIQRLAGGGSGAGLASGGMTAAPGARYLKFLRAGIGDTVRIIPVDDVIYLQAQDKYVSIYTADGEDLIRISLKELAEQLDPGLFVQVHRSTIVNLRAVLTADRDFTGRVLLTLRGVRDKVQVSRQNAHLFARM